MELQIDPMDPIEPKFDLSISAKQFANTKSPQRVQEMSSKQQIYLEVMKNRQDKEWYQYRDTFPTYSDKFLQGMWIISSIASLLQLIAYFIAIFQTSDQTFTRVMFLLFIAAINTLIIGTSLRTNTFLRFCYYECKFILNRQESAVVQLLLMQMFPFSFSSTTKLGLAGTIINLISGALSLIQIVIFLILWLKLVYQYSV
ncbi:Transmembrane_domain-containing protein [Hexamita inflata]|uniref:Partial n=1 Tax=Hexamita inflata TaxID=28002 RepID=A0AA86PRE2_9EUKA|nr:Transmembrane domain-containing protein [Hexamita inflata]